MLIGQYQHNIDAKNRVIVPAKFREDLGERFYVTKGLDGCLFVLSEEGWKRLQDKIVAMPMSKARQLQQINTLDSRPIGTYLFQKKHGFW